MAPDWLNRIMPTPPAPLGSSQFETYTQPSGTAKTRPPSGARCHLYFVPETRTFDRATIREVNPGGSCSPLASTGPTGA